MLYNQRHIEILKMLTRLRYVSVQDLTARMEVSEVTIRKDLSHLEEKGLLFRTRGGAELAEDSRLLSSMNQRRSQNKARKICIAKKASELIREGDTVFIDSGSTCLELCGFVKDKSLRVVTNSIDVMNCLGEVSEITLIGVGGNYRKEAGSFIGPMALEIIKQYNFETCFLGTTGFTKRCVFSSQNVLESQLKQQVIQHSARRVVLADSSKYGKSAFSVFARAGDIDILYTDIKFEDAPLFAASGIETITCPDTVPD